MKRTLQAFMGYIFSSKNEEQHGRFLEIEFGHLPRERRWPEYQAIKNKMSGLDIS